MTDKDGSNRLGDLPTAPDYAAVLDRVQWLCEGAQPSDYAEVAAAIRETVAE